MEIIIWIIQILFHSNSCSINYAYLKAICKKGNCKSSLTNKIYFHIVCLKFVLGILLNIIKFRFKKNVSCKIMLGKSPKTSWFQYKTFLNMKI